MPSELYNTSEYDSLIVRHLDNQTMTDEEKRQLNEWILKSKDNEIYFKNFVNTWEVSNVYLLDKRLAQTKLQEFYKLQQQIKTRKLIKWLASSAAAIVLLFICLQLFVPYQFEKELTVTSGDTKKEVILPDGSHVWLNTQSSIKYSKKFKKSRNVKLNGEALFDIIKSEGKNFIVETSNLQVEVLGTTFLVNDRDNANLTQTILESGAVNIKIKNTDKNLNLNPGELFTYNNDDGYYNVESVNASSYIGWVKDKLSFTNIPMSELIIQLEKWYNIDIVCNSHSILNTPVSITVDEESLDEILFLLSQIVPLNWFIDKENRIILN